MQRMHPRVILSVLFVFLLVFGCAGPSGPSGGAAQGGASQGGAPSGAANQTGGGTQGGAGNQSAGGADDLAGKAYAELMALGVPLKCEITMTVTSKPVQMTLYMKGSDEVRSEIPVEGGTPCATMITIMKGGKAYTGCDSGEFFPGCPWIEAQSAGSGGTGTGQGASTDFSSVPASEIHCVPWTYDASKFEPSGKVCTQQDIMNAYK